MDKIAKFINDNLNYDCVFIGTDSKNMRNTTRYVSVVAVYKYGVGGKTLRLHRTEKLANSLRHRLTNEAWYSLEVAMTVSKIIPEYMDIEVHLDVNKNLKFKSGKFATQLHGLITAQGFNCKLKPDSWCASSVADREVRNV